MPRTIRDLQESEKLAVLLIDAMQADGMLNHVQAVFLRRDKASGYPEDFVNALMRELAANKKEG